MQLKRIFIITGTIIIAAVGVFFLYFNNTSLADQKTIDFYTALKDRMRDKGYQANFLVISTKRFKWHNTLQTKISPAANKSRHLKGEAIDFLVFDVNGDNSSDSTDVAIVYNILDKKIVKNKGGIGTYIHKSGYFTKQMVHIDCRGYRARWD